MTGDYVSFPVKSWHFSFIRHTFLISVTSQLVIPVFGCLVFTAHRDLLAGVSFLSAYILLAGLGNEDRSIGRVEVQMTLLYPFASGTVANFDCICFFRPIWSAWILILPKPCVLFLQKYPCLSFPFILISFHFPFVLYLIHITRPCYFWPWVGSLEDLP